MGDLTFNLNTRGVFLCCQAEAKHMLARGAGKIINTASMASLLVPHPQKQAAYNCSKAAVVKMTQSLACEWADRGLNVNCISPGIVDTPLIWENPALNKLAGTWLRQIPFTWRLKLPRTWSGTTSLLKVVRAFGDRFFDFRLYFLIFNFLWSFLSSPQQKASKEF